MFADASVLADDLGENFLQHPHVGGNFVVPQINLGAGVQVPNPQRPISRSGSYARLIEHGQCVNRALMVSQSADQRGIGKGQGRPYREQRRPLGVLVQLEEQIGNFGTIARR